MRNRIVLSLITGALLTGLLFAHGDPIMGTVTAVGPDTITIKDRDNKAVVIMVEKATKFLMNDKPAKKTDVKVGDRVVIDVPKNTNDALEVKIGTAPKAPVTAPKAPVK